MKHATFITLGIAAVLSVSCNKQKTAIDENNDAIKDAIDTRKSEVTANAKDAIERTETNAKIDKARIEANNDSIQAQLDADKKVSDAEAAAAKARVDAREK